MEIEHFPWQCFFNQRDKSRAEGTHGAVVGRFPERGRIIFIKILKSDIFIKNNVVQRLYNAVVFAKKEGLKS